MPAARGSARQRSQPSCADASVPAAGGSAIGAQAPVSVLRGVGPQVVQRLARLGVYRVQDLLFHLPARYEDRTRVTPIGALRAGDGAVIQGAIELTQVKFGRRRSLLVRLADGTGAILLRFFHFSRAQQETLARGAVLRCYGEVRSGPGGLEIVHPEYRTVDAATPAEVEATLTPVYPSTEGLQQQSLRRLTGQALDWMRGSAGAAVEELLPADILSGLGLPPLDDALALVHRPTPDIGTATLAAGLHPAQRRLAFDEMLAHQLGLRRLRATLRTRAAPPFAAPGALRARLIASLPFALTRAQQRVAGEIAHDLALPVPMLRLVQGDVGSGKTVVAALAAAQALECGFQCALMAPTELLAEQHLRTFTRWFEPLAVPVLWLGGRQSARERRALRERLASTPGAMIVGTHALFQDDVACARLGLTIIDEQHRFGVEQRQRLQEKGRDGARLPHQLVMTATPIPRTLAMTAYADLDSSVLDELPPGRQPVVTRVVPEQRRAEIVARVGSARGSRRQVYWVCTLIEESAELEGQAATGTAAALAAALPDLRVGLVHGRMSAPERDAVMRAFAAGEIDLLVATTVIEVGVDVPNASLMVIENAERLGLSQLHQLRGRVGRGSAGGDCVLLYRSPLSDTARERLQVMRATTDGFVIAERDLELRGPGELLGKRQAGNWSLRIANLARDRDLLPAIDAAARRLIEHHPERVDRLIRRWLADRLHYGAA